MLDGLWFWLPATAAAVMVGMAKTGIPGLGILVVPGLMWVCGDVGSALGLLLPLLCAADLIAVRWYRRHAAAGRLFGLLPSVLVGMAAGFAILRSGLEQRWLPPVVGGIVLAMIGLHLLRRLRPDPPPPGRAGTAAFGFTAGAATTIANAAGPVMHLYLLGCRLPKEEFIATGAWFFLVVNLAKVPFYAAGGLFTGGSLLRDAVLLPAVLAGALAGRWLLPRLPQRAFEAAVLGLAAAGALALCLRG